MSRPAAGREAAASRPAGHPRSGLEEGRYRGLSLDVARRAFTIDGTVRLLDRMAELGLTALHLHLTETRRVGVRLPGFEELAAPDAWTAADCARLVAAADEAGIALIPEIDLPSHAAALLSGREYLQLRDRRGRVHADRLDVSHPESLELAAALLRAAAQLFPGDAVHLGGDEYFAAPWETEEEQRADRFPSLLAHGRSLVGTAGTAADSFAHFMNALAEVARDLGRTPLMWNDHVVPASQHPGIPISTDIVLDVWIRWRAWTPSVLDYLASGYRVMNSHGDLLYFVLSADGAPAAHGRRRFGLLEDLFRPRRFMGLAAQNEHLDVPPVPEGHADPVLGASLSVWCDAPEVLGEKELLALLDTWLVPFAASFGTTARAAAPAALEGGGQARLRPPAS
ncbi:family 20 glycosylhydrolase [Brachybacterium hainanense]|uniref:Family 20 glycosylhydrolase n=1 Tax=Brachybacterium hainanense TaxID=1541174 RepID=A0ABV6R8J6_9MICO